MSKRKFILLGYFLTLLFIFVGRVDAVNNFSVTVNGDMVTLKAKNVAKFQYSVNGGSAVNICTGLSDNSSYQTCRISVKNGTYNFTATSYAGTDGRFSQTIRDKVISSSCSDQSKTGQKGSGTVERCMVVDSKGKVQLASTTTIASCAAGYTGTLKVQSNGCTGLTVESGKLRYCKAVYAYNCTSGSVNVPAAKLSALSVNGFSLSPGFNADTKAYKVSVGAGVSSVTINATAASGSSFVQNYGPRTVNVKYGSNTYSVKVKNSAGKETVYKITVSRPDNRNKDNTLKRLTVDKGTLSPAFAAGTTVYSVSVDKEVTSISVGADLNHSSASFVDGYGPRTVNLNPGVNTIAIKVKNEAGSVKVYTIKVSKPVEGTAGQNCNLTPDKEPYLKGIHLGPETSNEGNVTENTDEEDPNVIPQIDNFDPEMVQYSGIKIPYIYEDLEIHPYVMNEGDTFEITGNEDLVVNVPTVITIKVTSKACPTAFHEYTLEVTRQAEEVLSSEVSVTNITIDGHDEFEFEQNETKYEITLSKKEKLKKSDFSVEIAKGDPDWEFEEPKEIAKGRKYKVIVTSEDGTNPQTYEFKIVEIKGGASSFWLIILAIIVILVIIYIVLRLMGYRIYFNPAMLGAMFRGNGKDKFDK